MGRKRKVNSANGDQEKREHSEGGQHNSLLLLYLFEGVLSSLCKRIQVVS